MPKLPGVNHLDAVRVLEKAGFDCVGNEQCHGMASQLFRLPDEYRSVD